VHSPVSAYIEELSGEPVGLVGGPRVDGEVAIDAGARNQADAIAFDRGRGRIDGVVDRVSVVIDENAAGVLAFSAWTAVD